METQNAPLKEKFRQDLKTALKEKNETKNSTIKMLLAAVQNKEIELGKKETGLTDDEFLSVIKSEVKKRQDALTAYDSAGRPELAEKEKAELNILQSYLPPELSDEEVEKTVKESIKELSASSPQDFGRVMKDAMAKLKGKARGDRVGKKVKELLGA